VIVVIDVLAALATKDLAEAVVSKVDRTRLWLLSIFFACSAAVTFVVVCRIAAQPRPEWNVAAVHLIVAWFGFALLAYLLKEERLSPGRFLRLTVALAFLDAAGALYLAQPVMYTSATLNWWHEVNAHHNRSLDLTSAGFFRVLHPPESLGTYPNNRNLSLKLAVFDSYITFWNRFHMQMAADPVLNQMAVGENRLWFSTSAVRQPPNDAAFRLYRDRVHELEGVPILVLHSRDQMLALASVFDPVGRRSVPVEFPDTPACVPAAVTDLSYQTDSLSFRYTAPAAGYLLVTDRWADGWEVTVNGQQRPVLGGNFIFRAVQVDRGVNAIRFQYHPRFFVPLLFLGWGTLLLVAAGQGYRSVCSRGRATQPPRLPAEGN
jgi:hypothetical protein